MKQPGTLREALGRLVDEGRVKQPEGGWPSPPAFSEQEEPWHLRALSGLGAWLAAGLFLIFLFAVFSHSQVLLPGLLLLAGAVWMRRLAPGGFAHQLAFASSLAGQVLVITGLFDVLEAGWAAYLLVVCLEILLIAVFPDPAHRFVSTVLGVIVLLVWVIDRGHGDLVHLLVACLMAGSLWLWLQETSVTVSGWGPVLRPVAYGLTACLLAILTVPAGFPDPVSHHWWISSLVLGAGLILLAYRILIALGLEGDGRLAGLLLGGLLLIAALSVGAPGIPGALLILLLGHHRGNRPLMGFALIFLALFLSHFYYSLKLTLLVKSGVLAATGLVLLVWRRLLAAQFGREANV